MFEHAVDGVEQLPHGGHQGLHFGFGASQATSGTNCWGQSFGYDRYGNLTAINSTQCSSPTMSVTVNAKNQVTNSGFTYDSGGNLTADGTYTYTWDGENGLASANGVTYTYDGDGKRVKKSSGTLYWYDAGGNVIEETDLNGNLVNDYIYAAGMRLARRSASGLILTYFTDPLGSSRYIQGAGGLTHAESDYYPFGGERVISNTLASANNYKFTGMERDSESGLDHTLFRQFTSTYGRWLSPDPDCFGCTNPQKLNRYAYVLNNPVSTTDPSGLGGAKDESSPPICVINGMIWPMGSLMCPPDGYPKTNPRSNTPSGHGGRPAVPFAVKYNKCAKQAFGIAKGKVPGTVKDIPGILATQDVLKAASATGVSAAIIGATLLAESDGILDPINATNSHGYVDVGPMQLNSEYLGEDKWHPAAAYGTDLTAGDKFQGDAYLNILAGASYLKHLGNWPENYVGDDAKNNNGERKAFLDEMMPKLQPFFDCLQKK